MELAERQMSPPKATKLRILLDPSATALLQTEEENIRCEDSVSVYFIIAEMYNENKYTSLVVCGKKEKREGGLLRSVFQQCFQ